ncbi:FtsB family cell division protein [Thermodesulfobacterium hydrogeniphilum]|uniref:FtsB family cell division protein n=1 Tax=Thermodesulfobacterium hydrogeniphilum TaxID=161156 RepID=UPI0005718EAE|nr:septum formation initiator family protein [Thermodesulfobacterium hydrogeniphilum]
MFKDYQPHIIIKPYKKKKRSKIKKFLLGILVISFILTLSVYIGLNFLIKSQVKNIEELKQENNYLKKEIQKFSSSDKAYDEILRTKYGYIKDGEKIIIYSRTSKK